MTMRSFRCLTRAFCLAFKSNDRRSDVSARMRQGLARAQYCEPRCQWNIDESVSNLGSLGGADIGDLLGEMYHDRSHLCRWNYIEEPQDENVREK